MGPDFSTASGTIKYSMNRPKKTNHSYFLTLGIILIILLQLVLQSISSSINKDDLLPPREENSPLSVDYFEPVFYNPSEILSQHRRKKREIGNRESFKFNLISKSRNFRLNLEEDNSVFHPEVVIENSDGFIPYDTSRVLVGHLEDEPGSLVEGLITSEGHFDGSISTASGHEFYIEPSLRYTSINPNASQGIVYESESIQWPEAPPTCASHDLHHHRLGRQLDNHNHTSAPSISSSTSTTFKKIHRDFQDPLKRKKRYIIDPRKKTCMLYLQADHLFYKYLGSEEAAINMMARHIQRVNEIYKTTDFDGDGVPDGVTFMIKRIKVHNLNHTSDPNYRYNGDFQVIKFLERFSEGDYESFCLAYMFTYRDFEGGTLGLAWTGDLKNAGGVCERKGHFRGGLKSLNTGIITLLNYGKVVLPAVSYVTLAHEIGHNFGSPHDPESDKECTPGGRDGNYIMYARATAGDQKNNQQFSPCSLRSIFPVLNAKARNTHGCFSEPQRAICGNREVEEGEECDCGWEEDCQEPCCWPMRMRYDPKETPCTLRPRKDCSPSQGPCCTGNCTLKIGDKCRDDNGCRHTAFCDGYMPACPSSVHKPNKTVCHEEQNVCFMGECTGSICLAYGLESCQCSPQPWDSASKMCELCCKLPGEGQSCKSSFEWNDGPFDVPNLFAKAGSPCKNYTGYCDTYHACREVDPSGPLATLRNLLLADEGLTAIAEWIDTHWYAVISFIALLIVMMILTAKMCGKQAKKKLRKITVMHSNVEAIQVERSYWDEGGEHVVHPEALRKKIPLRKKIRERKNKGKVRKSTKSSTRVNSSTTPGEAHAHNKGPSSRYGTLWRKKRGERSRVAQQQQQLTNLQKTETLNGDVQSPTSPTQTIDLIQLKTPGTSQGHKPVFPKSSAPSGSRGSNSPNGAIPGTSGSSPKGSLQSPSVGATIDPLSQGLVNHEPKTAILPSAGAGRRKRKSHKRSTKDAEPQRKSRSSSSRPTTKPTSRPVTFSKSSPTSPTSPGAGVPSSPRKKSISSPTSPGSSNPTGIKEKKPKKSIQIVYTPPFSVKVVQVDASEAVANTTPTAVPLTAPTNLSTPQKSATPYNPKVSKVTSKPSSSSTKHYKKVTNSPVATPIIVPNPPDELSKSNSTTNSSTSRPQPQVLNTESSKSSTSLYPGAELVKVDNGPPPPYAESDSNNAPNSTPSSSSTGATVPSPRPLPQGVKSKVKSSGSFLLRQKQKLKLKNAKSELRVLIPPANLEDEDVTSPVTPMS